MGIFLLTRKDIFINSFLITGTGNFYFWNTYADHRSKTVAINFTENIKIDIQVPRKGNKKRKEWRLW